MKKNLIKIMALCSFIPMLTGIVSCNDSTDKPTNPDINNGETDDKEPELSKLAKDNNCIPLKEAILKANEAKDNGTTKEFNISGTIKEISDTNSGTIVISDSKNTFLIQKITNYSSIKPKPKINDEIVISGNLKTFHNIPCIEEAKFIALGDKNGEYVPDTNDGEVDNLKYFESEKVKNMASRGSLGTIDSYYESCRGLKGTELKHELSKIISEHDFVSYGGLKECFKDVDTDPNDSSSILLCYTKEKFKKSKFTNFNQGVNREHVWPRSKGNFHSGDEPYSDAHMLRPCDYDLNESRSSKNFGEITSGPIQGCYSDDVFTPMDYTKGDTARAMFYFATCYSGRDGWNLELAGSKDRNRYRYFGNADGVLGDFDVLYKWATDPSIDPIDEYEMLRNNKIDQNWQHNRNPFVDHPEFIEMIYDMEYDGPGALI